MQKLDPMLVRILGAIFMALFTMSVKILWTAGSDINDMKTSMAKVALQLEIQSEITQDHETRLRRLEAARPRR